MTDAAERLQRSVGRARVGFKRRGAATALADLHQAGCAKLRLPRRPAGTPGEAVIITTAGGLTDGDRFAVEARWGRGAAATVTTQAAERIYRSRGGDAVITNTLDVEPAAVAMWLPQETILFEGACVARTLDADVAPDAALFACESLVFGRGAMGETLQRGRVQDAWRVRIDGRLAFADGFALDGDAAPLQSQLDRPAIANGARAVATALLIVPEPLHWIDALRGALSRCNVTGGASIAGPVIVVRALAIDPADLRRALHSLLDAIISGTGRSAPFAAFGRPRVFDC